MRTTNPVTIQRHVLPGEESGDTAWFQRQNPFGQREALRPVAFKRRCWPHLPDGTWSKRSTFAYPHILPAGHERLAFYEPLARGDRLDLKRSIVVRELRLLRRFETWKERTARHFACDCAEHVLPLYECENPRDRRLRKALETARHAVWAVANDTAAPGCDAAEYEAARAPERAWQFGRLMDYLEEVT